MLDRKRFSGFTSVLVASSWKCTFCTGSCILITLGENYTLGEKTPNSKTRDAIRSFSLVEKDRTDNSCRKTGEDPKISVFRDNKRHEENSNTGGFTKPHPHSLCNKRRNPETNYHSSQNKQLQRG